jgi:hypothetical protein
VAIGDVKKHPLASLTEAGVQIDTDNNVAPLRVLGYVDSSGVFQPVGVLKPLPVSATVEIAEVTKKVQLQANIEFSSSSAQTILAAPGAGYRIRLTRLGLYSGGEPPVNIEMAIKFGSRTIETVKGAGMVFDYPEHRNLGTNEALVIQATTADRVIGGVDYYVEAV